VFVKTPLKTTLAAALPLASLLWVTPPAVAHDGYRSHDHHRSWSESASDRRPYYGRDNDNYDRSYDWGRHRGYDSSWYDGKDARKYNKAMNRLERQEREARAKAYRRSEGDRRDPRYRERLAEIDRKYDHKRDKVERNWWNVKFR
jgi:hypothetical protein